MITTVSCLALASSISMHGASAGDAFNVDRKLWRYDTLGENIENESWSAFPVSNVLNISNSSLVCPSNQCKITEDEMTFNTDDNKDFMKLVGDFNLVDEQSNGHLGPKKQNLVEKNVYCVWM